MKVIRVKNTNSGETPIDPDVLAQKYYNVNVTFNDGSVLVVFDGRSYGIKKDEYETLTNQEVKELLFKKLAKEGQRLLDLGGPNE